MMRALAGWFKTLTLRAGALPARRVTWSLVLLFSVWVLLDVFVLHFTSGMARSSFDAMVRARVTAAAPDPRIVIIDIDEASLARMGKEFGRWPWPRDTLATVLDFIEKQQPAAIAWDVIFSDADRLSPGGDAAFNEAVSRSPHSHFAVVRLPPANDAASELTRVQLPGLWSSGPSSPNVTSTVALIAPVLPAVAASRLGFNNGYPDADGVLRRYRYRETLADGSQIQSMAAAVAESVVPAAARKKRDLGDSSDQLMAWRKEPQAYPSVSFADVFARAEGEAPLAAVPSFAGKVVVIGSTAPSLHDIHPTPLSPLQAGVESLATAIDNAINQRVIAELPRWLQAALAIALCIGIALWVQFRSVDSLAPALLALPAALLGIGYLSLNGSPIFLDLHLAAALALLFLAVLRSWNGWRQQHWCSSPQPTQLPLMLWPWWAHAPWADAALDRLIDALEQHAPSCRVIVLDAHVSWPGRLRWPELARHAAIVGPRDEILAARPVIEASLERHLVSHSGAPVLLDGSPSRDKLAAASLDAWASLQKSDTKHD
jgi:adenylate cyclase